MQVLKLSRKAGLLKLRRVALGGTKIKAHASKHRAMSYGRMPEAEPGLAAEVQQWLAQGGPADQAEDYQFGADRRGDEMPEWVADKRQRLAKIRAAKAALQAEAKAAAAAKRSGAGAGDGGQRKQAGTQTEGAIRAA